MAALASKRPMSYRIWMGQNRRGCAQFVRCKRRLVNNKHVHLRLCVFCILRGPTTLGVPPFALRVEWATQPAALMTFAVHSPSSSSLSLPAPFRSLLSLTRSTVINLPILFSQEPPPSLSPYNLASTPLPLPYRFSCLSKYNMEL